MAEKEPNRSRALTELQELLDSGRPIIYILSAEETRVAQLLATAARELFPKPIPFHRKNN